jgi:hypothetical protein
MPTEQVLRWHLRSITQPSTMSAPVATPNSSAPSSARDDDVARGAQPAVDLQPDPIAQAVLHQHLLRLGQPELPGRPACLMDESGEAPVPPSSPEMVTPPRPPWRRPRRPCRRPTSLTSFTLMRAAG